MPDLFGRYSLPNVLGRLFGHTPSADPGHYSLPNVLGRLFHHGQSNTGGYDPGMYTGGNPFTTGGNDFTNGYQVGSGGMFDIGNGSGFNSGDPYTTGSDPFAAGHPSPVGGGGGMGGVASIGGSGPSQTTNGFTTAFRGGGDVYDPAEFIQALRTKGGTAIS